MLLTGATGYLASMLLPVFRDRYELRLLDAKSTNAQGEPVEGVFVADLSDPDRGRYLRQFGETDVVVHLAYRHPGGSMWGGGLPPVDRFEGEFLNLRMTQNVYRCAYDCGVRRVVVASSNHAADWYEEWVRSGRIQTVRPNDLPLSDNFYGWAKASSELLGFVYACGALGRRMETVQIRVGAPRALWAEDYDADAAGYGGKGERPARRKFYRDLGAYISPRDLCQLFQLGVEAPQIEGEYGVPWLVVYGISDNSRAFWSLDNARRILRYAPVDNSEEIYAADIARLQRRVRRGPEHGERDPGKGEET